MRPHARGAARRDEQALLLHCKRCHAAGSQGRLAGGKGEALCLQTSPRCLLASGRGTVFDSNETWQYEDEAVWIRLPILYARTASFGRK